MRLILFLLIRIIGFVFCFLFLFCFLFVVIKSFAGLFLFPLPFCKLFSSFSQLLSCIAVGLKTGFNVYNTCPFGKCYSNGLYTLLFSFSFSLFLLFFSFFLSADFFLLSSLFSPQNRFRWGFNCPNVILFKSCRSGSFSPFSFFPPCPFFQNSFFVFIPLSIPLSSIPSPSLFLPPKNKIKRLEMVKNQAYLHKNYTCTTQKIILPFVS